MLGSDDELPGARSCSVDPANRDYQPGFAGTLMKQDLGPADTRSVSDGVDARMGCWPARSIRTSRRAGAGQDFSGIINTIRDESA